jgi:hypothetical protein
LYPRFLIAGIATLLLGSASLPARALTFNLTDGAGLTSLFSSNLTQYNSVKGAFNQAAALWSTRLSDNVTVNITVDYAALGPGILGSTSSVSSLVSYANFRTALIGDISSSLDTTATTNLQAGPSLRYVTNDSSGLGTRVVDQDGSTNNTFLSMNKANAKALGLTIDANNVAINYATSDGGITFSSVFGSSFDFDRSDGINSGQQDFIGIAAHEIGHALGFTSGVDVVDNNFTTNLNGFVIFKPTDMFRFSGAADTTIAGFGKVMDLAVGGTPYFSVDKGTTNLGAFSTGRTNGDGQQASHWKDNLGLGIMDPTAGNGELLVITNRDLQMFDAIGWNLSAAVPEPGTLAFLGIGLLSFGLRRRRR